MCLFLRLSNIDNVVLVLLGSGLYSDVVLSLRCLESEVLLLNAVMRPKIINAPAYFSAYSTLAKHPTIVSFI